LPERVETNIVNFELPAGDAARFVAGAAAHGVRLSAFSAHALRAVTHLDVSRAEISDALVRLAALARGAARA
jgi:threonine aldolase